MEEGDVLRVVIDPDISQQEPVEGVDPPKTETCVRLYFLVKRKFGDQWEQMQQHIDIETAAGRARNNGEQVLVPVVDMVHGCKATAQW
jgi:hypothetical protein